MYMLWVYYEIHQLSNQYNILGKANILCLRNKKTNPLYCKMFFTVLFVQVLKCNPDCHILACTPSNSAADLIAQRLVTHVSKADVMRLNAASRNIQTIPEKIRVGYYLFLWQYNISFNGSWSKCYHEKVYI